MAKSRYSENLIRMKCADCARFNYYTTKNRKSVEKKLELKKYCKWCRKHITHNEYKK